MCAVKFSSSLGVIFRRHYSNIRKRTGFVDNVRVFVRGGAGGQGLPRFGGVGGKGGSVLVVGDEKVTLNKLTKVKNGRRYIGGAGENSSPRALLGAAGKDAEILVPPGVEVTNESGRKLGEVNKPGERLFIVKGGDSGGPWNNFCGQKGTSFHVRLDLKLIADIGLVGFPNAGKSTLLKAMSRASPKIASYPFTTIEPQLGIMQYNDQRQISMADLPGLIEGAHQNIGLGYRFLKHVERTKVLLFVVDLHGFQLGLTRPFRSALDTLLLLNKELELYKPELLSKPAVLVINKIDKDHPDIDLDEVIKKAKNLSSYNSQLEEEFKPKQLIEFDEVIPISAQAKTSTEYLKDKLRILIDIYAESENHPPSKSTSLETVSEDRATVVQKGPILL